MEATRQEYLILELCNLKTRQALVVAVATLVPAMMVVVIEVEEEDGAEEEAVDMEELLGKEEVVEEEVVGEVEAILLHASLRRLHKDVSELIARFSILLARIIQGHTQEQEELQEGREQQQQTLLHQEAVGDNPVNLIRCQAIRIRHGSNPRSQLHLIIQDQVALEERSRASLETDVETLQLVHLIIPTRQIRQTMEQQQHMHIRIHHLINHTEYQTDPTAIQTQLLPPQ